MESPLPSTDPSSTGANVAQPISFWTALAYWTKLGFINFGGPAGQMAMMHQELVVRKRWVSEGRFLHAMKFCMLLPGPEAQQLAIYIGWLFHGLLGGIVAGTLFILPSVLILGVLAFVHVAYGDVPAVAALFAGIKPVMVAIVAFAVWRIGSRALRHAALVAVAGAAFLAAFLLRLPFPAIVLAAGLVGYLGARYWPSVFRETGHGHGAPAGAASGLVDQLADRAAETRPTLRRNLTLLAAFALLWAVPIALLWVLFGSGSVWLQQAIFFTKAAFVTFGGAYAVLPYVAEAGVTQYGWVTAGEMLDGLALAETTPGPLIMFTQWVGFLGAWKYHLPLTPLAAGVLGALTTTYFTFLPCFLMVFIGAPYMEQLRENRRLSGALTGITAAVVGVILNLSVVLGRAILFPAGWRPDWVALGIAAAALLALWRLKWQLHWVVAAGAAIGLVGLLL